MHSPKHLIKWLVVAVTLYGLAALAAPEQQTWSFAVAGDSRNNDKVFGKLTRLIRDDPSHPELLLHTGDMVGACDQTKQWAGFHKCLDNLGPKFPVYTCIGNHEMKGDAQCQAIYLKETHPPGGKTYYAFSHRNALFISLNTEEEGHVNAIGPEQMAWLKKQLDKSTDRDYTFVFLHRPLFPIGVYKDQPLKNRRELHSLFEAQHITAVFWGHEHQYGHQDKDGVHYFHAASSGAPIYKGHGGEFSYYLRVTLSPGHARVRAIDVDGKVRDDVDIAVK